MRESIVRIYLAAQNKRICMRYDYDLTVEAVTKWAQHYFESPIKVYNFTHNFLVISKNEVILIRKTCGTVEVRTT